MATTHGQVNASTGRIETAKPKGKQGKLIPFTKAPSKIARALWH